MATTALTAATLGTIEARAKVSTPRGPRPVMLGLLSGVMLWASFPPFDLSWLVWFALTPLFLLISSGRGAIAIYLGAWTGGLVFWVSSTEWLRLTEPGTAWVGWLAMGAVFSLSWPIFIALTRPAARRLKLPILVVAPVAWVAIEHGRAYFLTGFPWYYLAHTQYRFLELIQIADFGGALLVSLLIAFANACFAELLTLPLLRPTPKGTRLSKPAARRLGTLACLLAGTLIYGLYRTRTAEFRPGPRIALLQSDLVQHYKEGRDQAGIVRIYEKLVIDATKSEKAPDLIVWPETSYPYGYVKIADGLSDADFAEQINKLAPFTKPEDWRVKKDRVSAQLREWTNAFDIPMIIGAITYDFVPGGPRRYNSAILFEPKEVEPKFYHKLHLVPFGEFVPFIKTMPWLKALTPYGDAAAPNLAFGERPVWFDRGPYRYAPAICFEDTVSDLVRGFFHEAPGGRHPDVLINLSNDGWFEDSVEHEMHLAASVFRAVENRVPLARSANTGISALINGNGEILASLPKRTEGVIVETVPLDDRVGIYTGQGEWVGFGCSAIAIGLLPMALLRGGRGKKDESATDPVSSTPPATA